MARRENGKERAEEIFERLTAWRQKEFGGPGGTMGERIAKRRNQFQTLLCIALSARSRDERTEPTCEKILEVIKAPQDVLALGRERLEEMLKPLGMYKSKADRLLKMARYISEELGGRIPRELDSLVKIPGVGVKTAALYRGLKLGIPDLSVDTHVHRISNLLGLVSTKIPSETRRELMKILPRSMWVDWNNLLVSLGRTVCRPLKHECSRCPIRDLCPSAGEKVRKR